MAHTHGPWILDSAAAEGAVYCSDATGSIVARTRGDGFEYAPRPTEEWTANARLIAAAPDLLASLKETREALAAAMRVIHAAVNDKADIIDDLVEAMTEAGITNGVGVRAGAAIAKAEGQ